MLPLIVAIAILSLPLRTIRKPLSVQLGHVAIAWLLLTGLQALAFGPFGSLYFPGSQTAGVRDTFIELSHFRYEFTVMAVLSALAAAAWLTRPTFLLASVAFWTLHAALSVNILLTRFATRLIVDASTGDYLAQAERLEVLKSISTAATVVALLALVLLTILIIASLVRQFLARW